MDKYPNIFEQFLFEAPGDDPPDTAPADISNPPDIPEDATLEDPPDIPDDPETTDDDAPPDMMGDDDFSSDGSFTDGGEEGESSDSNVKNLGLDDKVSAIMNMNLYQKYLSLLSNIRSQQASIRSNMDILYTLSPDTLNITKSLSKLDENIHLYLKNYFVNENYSKNLLFFNKCLNLLKLLNDSFDKGISKGIKDIK